MRTGSVLSFDHHLCDLIAMLLGRSDQVVEFAVQITKRRTLWACPAAVMPARNPGLSFASSNNVLRVIAVGIDGIGTAAVQIYSWDVSCSR